MERKIIVTGLILVLVSGAFVGRTARADDKNPDAGFVTKASAAIMLQIQTSGVAQGKGTNDGVKKLARQVGEDAQKATGDLSALAVPKGLTTSTGVEPELMVVMQKLNAMDPGPEFDKAYANLMVQSHGDAVKLFEDESKDGGDADVKAYAAKVLPILKDHLKAAKELADKVGAGSGATTAPAPTH